MKKRFSMLIALVMLLTSLIPSFTANAAFSDVSDTNPYREAISTLSTLSVIKGYDDGTFGADKDISRAEFTAIIVRMLGLDHMSTLITTFPDVKSDHWANANINTAFDLGIINGFDDGLFRPDDPVTYEQALKMLVCTLGYEPFAEAAGGYPTGYTNQAAELGMTDKVTGLTYSQNAPRGVVAQIMFNSLEVHKYEDVGNGLKDSGKTLLKDYLNVMGVNGTLVGVGESTTAECTVTLYDTQLAVLEPSTKDIHVINFENYNITTAQLIAMLGNTVQVYFQQDKMSNDKALFNISNEMYSNTEITIKSTEITDYSGNSIKYTKSEDAKASSAYIDTRNLSIRYNGRAATATEVDIDTLLNPKNAGFFYGTVKLVGNSASNSYNMIEIYNYDTYVAQRTVTSTDYTLFDKTVPTKKVVLDPLDKSLTITKNGSEIEPTSIVTGDVVLYAESLDGKHATVEVSSKSESGTINSVNVLKDEVTISNQLYVYSDYFDNYMTTKEQKTLAPGATIKVYMDTLGTLQWGTITASDTYYPYAYVIGAYEGNDECALQLFAPTSTSTKTFSSSTSYDVKLFKLAENVRLNGSKTSPLSVVSTLNATQSVTPEKDGFGSPYQFIRIGFNSSGQISHVITITGSGIANIENEKLVQYNYTENATVSSSTVKSESGASLYSIKTSTPLFIIPKDRTDTDAYALKNAISSSSLTANSASAKYDLAAYDLNESKYPAFMVWYQGEDDEAVTSGTPISVDTKYSFVWESSGIESVDGNEVTKHQTYDQTTTASEKKFASTQQSESEYSQMSKGDIALFGYDKDGLVDNVKVILSYSDILAVFNEETPTYSWESFSGVDATGSSSKKIKHAMYNVLQTLVDDNLIYVTKDAFTDTDEDGIWELSEDNYESLNIANAKIVKYNSSADTLTEATINDLKGAKDVSTDCSKIAVMSYQSSSSAGYAHRFIVIYE